jgi:dihydroorotate dehydrogenase electron transfer subunit
MSAERSPIYLEDAAVIHHRSYAGNQYILRVHAPAAAATARPGAFAHVTCHASIPMRRPLSIMRADRDAGWLEFLYKPVGAGLAMLARREVGELLSVLAPIGHGFEPDSARPQILAVGGGVGIPPMIFLASELAGMAEFAPVVLMGSEAPFPFELVETAHAPAAHVPGATHGLRMLDEFGIPSRLASNSGLPGCYAGHVTVLAEQLLAAASPESLRATQLMACGPGAMLRAVARVARRFDIPCQVALEEFMACGVGGCAGCAVKVRTPTGDAMKRVCVDGPVFDAAAIYDLAE